MGFWGRGPRVTLIGVQVQGDQDVIRWFYGIASVGLIVSISACLGLERQLLVLHSSHIRHKRLIYTLFKDGYGGGAEIDSYKHRIRF